MNNTFNENQLSYMYGNKKFLLFLSNYFSTYSVKKIILSGEIIQQDSIQYLTIYIRILLANINDFVSYIEKVEKNISFSYEEVKVKVSGGIKGRILVNEYVKNKSMVRLPREYPCVVKKKTYNNVENQYLVYIVSKIICRIEKLIEFITSKNIVKGYETELILLRNSLDYFISLLKKAPFNMINSISFKRENYHGFPANKLKLIETRFIKSKIINNFAYRNLFDWYMKFKDYGFAWIDSKNIKMLTYDDTFCNKLFEIWNLYMISETFQNKFNMKLIDKNQLIPGMKEFVFRLRSIDNSIIEIYYQKGSGLYWDDKLKQNWSYIREDKNVQLMGIPDISVKYISDHENLTIIDLKNRIRNSGDNSEEIYKMIGYFSNFNKYLQEHYNKNYKNQAVLIFRNDIQAFEEYLESQTGERILCLSIGVEKNINVNEKQFVKVCKYILDNQGITGTKSETITNCNENFENYQKLLESAITNKEAEKVEEIVYRVIEQNHSIIRGMFSANKLKSVMDKKKQELMVNHFPHIWGYLEDDVISTLIMAECLFSGLSSCDQADYAPVCLEFCRALEIQLNSSIFIPFKKQYNIKLLIMGNKNYSKLNNNRNLTLGECIFLLEKCIVKNYPVIELYNFIEKNIKKHEALFNVGLNILRKINVNVRRRAAHTSIMSYNELLDARQMILGIGNPNVLYMLLDNRQI